MSLGKLKSNNNNNRIEKPKFESEQTIIDNMNGSDYPIVRRRISKACNYCRQRKIKCNGNTPCLNCKNHQIECTYSKTIRKKKKPTTKKLTLQDLEKRMNKMDSKFELLNDKLTSILSILSKNNLTEGTKTEIKDDDNNIENDAGIISSEDEEDYDEDEDDQQSIDDESQHLQSPLSNYSSSESSSINNEYNMESAPQLINSTNIDQNFIPQLSGGYNILGNDQFENNNGSGISGFDLGLGHLDNKNNYLYDLPIMETQIDGQGDVF